MAFNCRYLCGSKFTAKCSCQRHENNSCKRRPVVSIDSSNMIKPMGKIQIKLSNKEEVIPKSEAVSEIILNEMVAMSQAVKSLTSQLNEMREELHKQKAITAPNLIINNINGNNNTVNNYFGEGSIELFDILRHKHGGERAVSLSNRLLKGKTKETKHDWVTNSDIGLDLKSLSRVLTINYESGEKDPCFHIINKEHEVVKDREGTSVDKILTNTVVNANLKAHNYVIKKARKARRNKQIRRGLEVDESSEDDSCESEEEDERGGMWDYLSNASIYNPNNGETYHDDIARYEKILPSKKHMIRVVSEVKNLGN